MNKRAWFILLLVGWLLTACAHPAATTDDALVEVLVDLYVLEAREQRFGDVAPGLPDSVLTHHGFTRETIREALEALSAHPERGDSVYARVERLLLARRQEADSLARRPTPADVSP